MWEAMNSALDSVWVTNLLLMMIVVFGTVTRSSTQIDMINLLRYIAERLELEDTAEINDHLMRIEDNTKDLWHLTKHIKEAERLRNESGLL